LIITLPALYAPKGTTTPVAFYAVTSITVIGLFTAFAIPIFLRWRKGDAFVQGEWNLGKNWKWMAPLAVAEVTIVSIYFMLPTVPAGIPFRKGFSWTAAQYAPIVVAIVIGGALIWWFAGAKNRFKGPELLHK
jgi:undecaprenyl pyrophosphate phosphatase UppP